MKKIEPEEEEFEEFEEDLEDEEDEEQYKPKVKPIPKPAVRTSAPQEPVRREPVKRVEEKPEPVQPQYVAVPRAVPVETMLNELYDSQQEMRQILLTILEKLK
jgi:hypothetical protein